MLPLPSADLKGRGPLRDRGKPAKLTSESLDEIPPSIEILSVPCAEIFLLCNAAISSRPVSGGWSRNHGGKPVKSAAASD